MEIFVELSLIIVISTAIAGLMRLLKQPLLMGYIITGLIVGPYLLNLAQSPETLDTFSQMGIATLLFIVGLNLSPKVVKEVGKAALVTGFIQIAATFGLGYFLSILLGYTFVQAFYLAIAFTFSSTIVVLKLLGDKKDLEKLYGRISIGILLLQDVVAVLTLVIVSSFSHGNVNLLSVAFLLAKGSVITIVLVGISLYLLPKFQDFFAKSQEYLFIFSLGWGFGIATLFYVSGLSLEIGALIAGVVLAVSPYSQEMSAKLRPLRDFFVVIFFVLLGMKMEFSSLSVIIVPALVFIALNLIGKPLIIFSALAGLKHNKKVGFQAGVSLSQISEFSLIVALLGVQMKHIDSSILSLITLVALFTIATSSYLIMYSDRIFETLSKNFGMFRTKKSDKETGFIGYYDVVLFGCNRVGYDFVKIFKKLGSSFLIVDFNPDVIKELNEKGFNCRYGDASDAELLDDLCLDHTQMIISTIPDFKTNLFILSKVRKINKSANIIVISYDIDEAIKLYEADASYVIMPHFISGQYAADLAENHVNSHKELSARKKEHMEYLKERKSLGHAHPAWAGKH